MVVKIFKATWFFSCLITFAVFLYVYASLQETVVLQEGPTGVSIHRETFFYSGLILLAFINLLVFVVAKLYSETHNDFKSWFYGLIITINFFFVIGLSFINLINSGEKFQYNQLGVIIYGSVGLLIVWIVAWPIYLIYKSVRHQ